MAHSHEPFIIQREVDAVMVPSGHAIKLQPGLAGFISQALGGSFTLYIEGNLYRLAGTDADAIGKEPLVAPELPPNATEDDVRKLAWQQMKTCYDPEIPINIVDLGLIYDCNVTANDDGSRDVEVQMTLTAPGCGMGEVLVQDVREKVLQIPTVREARVDLVFDPPWRRDMMSPAAQLQMGMM
ncbi:MAG: putative Fe-S cluster assembly protein SufT [Proteobacteria bacterium]|jgi:probable FeS assembly SUF system protein SufT|nr:putative Fe-S cluster assembly protein SufT [Pseudomonadota bacterium]MCC6631252.1 putative Fe-S cluster assembly protein SufT [Gammaproteobacteria bacterium]